MKKTDAAKRSATTIPRHGFLGHPKGLMTLFFTEFWERFSYYGMKAILLYYMYYAVTQGGLGLDQNLALAIVSIYGALVYMSGIIGGWLADRIFGQTRAVFYGGILIMLGHICLAIPGKVPLFFMSMVLIVIGTGLLKPNVSSIVGELYGEGDARRDAGFSIFYMGINLGGFLAPIVVGTVGMKIDFHLGFSIAAIGMLIGLIVFVTTRKRYLGTAGTKVDNPLSTEEKRKTFVWLGLPALLVAAFVAIGIPAGWLTVERFINLIGILGLVLPAIYFIVMYRSPKTTAVERSRVLAYIPLFAASIVFWAIQEQGATILASYADNRTRLDFAGIHLSPAWFQSLNPLFIIVFAPVFAWLWVRLGDRQPSIPKKFSLGLLFAGLSFLVVLVPGYFGGTETLVNPLWLVLSYFLVVVGELCLSPVGLSATTKLAPAAFASQTMSLWFLSNSAAQAINAQLVKFYSPEQEMAYFGIIGCTAIVSGFVLLLAAPKIQSFMKGVQ